MKYLVICKRWDDSAGAPKNLEITRDTTSTKRGLNNEYL